MNRQILLTAFKLSLIVLGSFIATSTVQAQLSEYDLGKPFGWATIGDETVTGGEGGPEVIVTTEEELDAALNNNDQGKKETDFKRIIYLKGEIRLTTMHSYHVQNKTIYGLPGSKLYNTNQDKKNGGLLKFTTESRNLILRNVTIEGPGAYDVNGDDALLFQGAEYIWIDHCTIGDGLDSSLDANNGSDHITVTWTRFRYNKPPRSGGSETDDHRFCCTWGASDGKADVSGGKLNTTFAYCWWDEGVMERAPRVRFGKVHVLNCYYTNVNNHYCLGYGYMSNIYAENCYFSDGVTPAKNYAIKKGYLDYNLQVYGCRGMADTKQQVGNYDYWQPSDYYPYNLIPTEDVPGIVGNEDTGAGANLMVEVGKGVTGYVNGGDTPTPPEEPILGDLDDDKSVTTTDVTILYNVIFGTDVTTDKERCNIDGSDDPTPNTSDVTSLYNIIFGTNK